jgi:hypothetical protein
LERLKDVAQRIDSKDPVAAGARNQQDLDGVQGTG